MTHALVIGEALIDIVDDGSRSPIELPGGSPANVALSLARLGRAAHLATWYATDPRGHAIRDHLAASGVTIVPGSNGAARTSTALATLDHEGAATYEFDLLWNVPEVHLGNEVGIVHSGSIAATLRPGADAVAEIAAAAREHSTISYDVNARPSIMGTPVEAEPLIERMAARADVVKASDEDFLWLYPHEDPHDVARTWATQGPAIVIVTQGSVGSFAATSAGVEVTVAAPSVEVVDTVGAGDSYMAGLLDGLWTAGLVGGGNRAALHAVSGSVLRTAMEWAAKVAAVTVSRAGANPPRKAELA